MAEARACTVCGSSNCEDSAHTALLPRIAEEFDRERARRIARRQLDAEERGPVAIPEILTLRERLARPRPVTEWRIQGWQPAGARALLAAPFKAGKTTLRDNLTRSLVDGAPFLGAAYVTPIPGTVVLLDFEMSASQLDTWIQAQRIVNDDRVIPVPLRGMVRSFDVFDAAARAVWASRLRRVDCSYLILDCLRPVLDAFGLDEHHDAGRFLVAFDALLEEAGIDGALVCHHMGHAGVDIEIHTASFRAVRGYTCVGVVADEIAFWPTDDAADPDREILAALRPSLATVPGALLIALSSPYARRGELWKTYAAHYGREGSAVLVWQADTRTMHPAIDGAVIDAAYAEDEVAAASEYGAQFRRDLAPFVSRDLVDGCVDRGCVERGAERRVRYIAFTDPSGGSSDSFTLAIAHREGDGAVLDALREVRAPFDPSVVVGEFAKVLRTYGVTHVYGDRYAGEWPREAFRKHGITYRTAEHPKSELYLHLLPMLTSGRARLLDHPRLVAQLTALERRTSRGGRDSIDHAPGSKDDVANAVAGALTSAGTLRRGVAYQASIVNGAVDFGTARREAEARQDWPDPPPLPPATARHIGADGIVRGGATRWAQWEDIAPKPRTTPRRR